MQGRDRNLYDYTATQGGAQKKHRLVHTGENLMQITAQTCNLKKHQLIMLIHAGEKLQK